MVQLSIVYSVLALRRASEDSGVHGEGSLLRTPPSPPLSGRGRSNQPTEPTYPTHTLHTLHYIPA
jgi:hypothetical protein